ncbi:DUF4386 domain-containing protein [Paenibacillus sp. GCM10023252]|uniref:DUF4386 domain-containing protein n=1 Tax=Paenibacillus sp. GCM10023252 TaxID=3252649 RepID=UPI003616E0D3
MTRTSSHPRPNQRSYALTAGTALLLMALAAMFSYGYVHGRLLEQGDAAVTYMNLTTHAGLFLAGIAGWTLILICDLITAWSLYLYLKPTNQPMALLGAWLRLLYTALLGVAVMNLIYARLLTMNTESGMPNDQLQAQTMLYVQAFDTMWSLGLIVFGTHLLVVGTIAMQPLRMPRWIGGLLLLAGTGYVMVHGCHLLIPDYDSFIRLLEAILTAPMAAGELALAVWLLSRGGKAVPPANSPVNSVNLDNPISPGQPASH